MVFPFLFICLFFVNKVTLLITKIGFVAESIGTTAINFLF